MDADPIVCFPAVSHVAPTLGKVRAPALPWATGTKSLLIFVGGPLEGVIPIQCAKIHGSAETKPGSWQRGRVTEEE